MTVRGKGGSEVALDLVAFLNHRSQEPPPLSMFRRREWLRLHFGQWGGARLICWCFRDDGFERGRLHFIGEVPPEPGDPTESSKAGCRWPAIAAILERVPRSTTEP
ncbi:MAG: hypothetical protein ACAI43_04885 [Phycisphaerae bacterium]|nr:hypothetical protein [Tepidisphaeraceae bacterium]